MEKQEFLMEVVEISRGAGDASLRNASIAIVKEYIKMSARQGLKTFRAYARYNLPLDINGMTNMSLPISATIDFFRDQGFNVQDEGNGYMTISWE